MSPLVLPKLPSRVYVRFGEAITLEGLDKSDKEACQEAYETVKVNAMDTVLQNFVLFCCSGFAAARLGDSTLSLRPSSITYFPL